MRIVYENIYDKDNLLRAQTTQNGKFSPAYLGRSRKAKGTSSSFYIYGLPLFLSFCL